MAKKKMGFDPSMLDTVIEDVKALNPLAQKLVTDLVSLLSGKPKMQSAQAVKCGPDGCEDCGECLDCAINCQLQALASTVQAQKCHQDGGE